VTPTLEEHDRLMTQAANAERERAERFKLALIAAVILSLLMLAVGAYAGYQFEVDQVHQTLLG
jgi:hypothetical protein